jgi:cell division transport system permease protein
MQMISFFRVIRTGLVNFRRNIWLSAASTLIMVITLIILSVLSFLFVITNSSVKAIRDRVDISAYFKTNLPENQILSAKDDIEREPGVKEVVYISAEQALKEFKERRANDPIIVESVNELSTNPLPATLNIKADNLEDYDRITQVLQSTKYKGVIEKVNFDDNRTIIDRLNTILRFIVTFGSGLVLVFALIAILVIFNTITLIIYNRREEVEIMRLVGATNWYIRGPFLVEALTYSIAATIITGAILFPLYTQFLPKIGGFIAPDLRLFDHPYRDFAIIVASQLVVSVVLSSISSLLAIRRYLKI